MSTTHIAIIVRTQNRPTLLHRCLTSLVNQRRLPDKVVIVNDGGESVDSLVTEFTQLNYHIVTNEEAKGRAYAANQGVAASHCEWIAFLDDDDIFLADHLFHWEQALHQTTAQAVYTGCRLVQWDNHSAKVIGEFNDDYDAARLGYENYIPLINLLVKRSLFLEIDGFDTKFDIFEDWDLIFRLSQKTDFYHISYITTEYTLWGKEQVTQAATHQQWQQAYQLFLQKHAQSLPQDEQLDFLTNYWQASQHRRGLLTTANRENQQLNEQLSQQELIIQTLKNRQQRLKNYIEQLHHTLALYQKQLVQGLTHTELNNILLTQHLALPNHCSNQLQTLYECSKVCSEVNYHNIPLPRPLSPLYPNLRVYAGNAVKLVGKTVKSGEQLFPLFREECLIFSLNCQKDNFCRFSFTVATYQRLNFCYIRVIIRDAEDAKNVLRTVITSALSLKDNGECAVGFEPIAHSKNHTYHIEIDSPNADEKNLIGVWCHDVPSTVQWREEHSSHSLQLTNVPNILVIEAKLPRYDEDSGSLRLFTLLTLLVKLGYNVTFFADNQENDAKYQQALEDIGVNISPGLTSLSTVLQQRIYDFAVVCRVDIAYRYIPFLRLACPTTKILYDTVDIHYIREMRQAEIEKNQTLLEQAMWTKRKELSNCLLADHTLVITEADGVHLQKSLPELQFSIIPNIHSIPPVDENPFNEREGIVFIGNYSHKPNEDAVYFLVDNILPLIHQQQPNINLYLIGSQMPEKIKALASDKINIVGWVETVEPEFAKRRLFVSYLRYGAGMKGKIGQALAVGLPVITNSIGAEGMGLIHEETAMIADDPNSFAQVVCQLYQDADLWKKLSQQGRKLIEDNYGEKAVEQRLKDIFS